MILLIYLLKLLACTAVFYAYYFLVLRNKRMHQYNRFYILASVILSMVLPLIKLPLLPVGNEETITPALHSIAFGGWEDEIIITAQNGLLNSIITKKNIIIGFYLAGLLVAIYPVITSLLHIRSLSLRHAAKELQSVWVYDTAEPGTPFSFFNSVYWNNKIPLDTEEGQQILMHELYHIKQKHSYDIMFLQLACSLFWVNPFFYLMNKELRAIHEFLADEYAISATNKHQYAELLVMQAISSKQVFISNQFFYNQIKRRIAMILQNNNSRYSNFRKVMAMPVLMLIFCACSVKNKDQETNLKQSTEANKVDGKKDTDNMSAIVAKIQQEKSPKTDYNDIFTKVEIEPGYVGGSSAWITYLNKNFNYPKEAQEKESQGTVLVRFVVEKNGNVRDVEVLKGAELERFAEPGTANYSLDESLQNEAIRMIAGSGKWLPAVQDGHAVSSYKIQPITFKLEAE